MFSFRIYLFSICALQWSIVGQADDLWQHIALQSTAQVVAPMTGIVLWDDNEKNTTDAIQLEYSYVGYDHDTLRSLDFGLFDDSFLSKEHPKVNALNWQAFGADRWQRVPGWGEFSYYNKRDQRLALAPSGPNGDSFEKAAARFHIPFTSI